MNINIEESEVLDVLDMKIINNYQHSDTFTIFTTYGISITKWNTKLHSKRN